MLLLLALAVLEDVISQGLVTAEWVLLCAFALTPIWAHYRILMMPLHGLDLLVAENAELVHWFIPIAMLAFLLDDKFA